MGRMRSVSYLMPRLRKATSNALWYTRSEYPGPNSSHICWAMSSITFFYVLLFKAFTRKKCFVQVMRSVRTGSRTLKSPTRLNGTTLPTPRRSLAPLAEILEQGPQPVRNNKAASARKKRKNILSAKRSNLTANQNSILKNYLIGLGPSVINLGLKQPFSTYNYSQLPASLKRNLYLQYTRGLGPIRLPGSMNVKRKTNFSSLEKAGLFAAGVITGEGNITKEALAAYKKNGAKEAALTAGSMYAQKYPNKVNNVMNKVKNVLGTNRNAYFNSISNLLKQSAEFRNIPNYQRNLKNAGLLAFSNYMAEQIGYTNNSNTRKIDAIIRKLMSLKQTIINKPNSKNKFNYGYEMGRLLGDLITSYSKLPAGSGRYKNVGNGALAGVLEHTVGKNTSNAVRRVIVLYRDPTKQNVLRQNLQRLVSYGTPAVKAGVRAWAGNLPGATKEVFLPTSQYQQQFMALNKGPNAVAASYIQGELLGAAGTALTGPAKQLAMRLLKNYIETRAPLNGETPNRFRNRMKKLAIEAASAAVIPVGRRVAGPLLTAQRVATNKYYNLKTRMGY